MDETTAIKGDKVDGTQTPHYINPSILSFLSIILKKWLLILVVAGLAGIAGIAYAFMQKQQYESRLTFALDAGSSDGLAGAMNLAAQFGLGMGSGQNMFDGDNILQIMKSRRIIEKVLLSADTFNGKSFTLLGYYLEMSGKRKLLNSKPQLKNVAFPAGIQKKDMTYQQDSILNSAYLDFSSSFITAERPDKKLSIYEVKVKSLNEQFTKDFTDRLVQATSSFFTEITSKKDRETLQVLEQRVASLKGNVGSSIDVKSSSQDANVNPAFAAAQSPVLKEQYNIQAYGEAYKELFKTLEIARYQYLKKIPLLQIIDDADYPMKVIRVGKLKTGLIAAVFAASVVVFFIWLFSLFKRLP